METGVMGQGMSPDGEEKRVGDQALLTSTFKSGRKLFRKPLFSRQGALQRVIQEKKALTLLTSVSL